MTHCGYLSAFLGIFVKALHRHAGDQQSDLVIGECIHEAESTLRDELMLLERCYKAAR